LIQPHKTTFFKTITTDLGVILTELRQAAWRFADGLVGCRCRAAASQRGKIPKIFLGFTLVAE